MIVVKGHLGIIKLKSISIRFSLGFDLCFCLVVSNYLFWVHGFRLLVKQPIYKYRLIVIIVSSWFWISSTLLYLWIHGVHHSLKDSCIVKSYLKCTSGIKAHFYFIPHQVSRFYLKISCINFWDLVLLYFCYCWVFSTRM